MFTLEILPDPHNAAVPISPPVTIRSAAVLANRIVRVDRRAYLGFRTLPDSLESPGTSMMKERPVAAWDEIPGSLPMRQPP